MVKLIIASGLTDKAKHKLNESGIKIFEFGINDSLADEVAFHADLSFLADGNDTLFIAEEMSCFSSELNRYFRNIIVIPDKLSDIYPHDVYLNCAVCGNSLICNIDTVSKIVLQYFTDKNYRIINVRQGYTKCSVIPVSENALITDDLSVFTACKNHGFDVLLVKKGSVRLRGYDYGFIGGAAGFIADDVIAFCGDINTHSDAVNILDFLNKYNIRACSLDDCQLYDIGSIIPVFGG